jgi:hypothetical protein
VSDPRITPEALRADIAAAQERRDRAYKDLEAAEQELEWLQQGLKRVEPGGQPGDDLLGALLPGLVRPVKPTLRQAIVLVMRSNPHKQWVVDDITSMLRMNNWLPRTDPGKRITDAAHGLVVDGYLSRADRGTYELTVDVAEALKRTFPPITDYTVPRWGIGAPDHIAAGPGLADP